jgi:hypothetical protein
MKRVCLSALLMPLLMVMVLLLAGCGGGEEQPAEEDRASTQPVRCVDNPKECI